MFYQLEHIGVPEYITVERKNNFSFPPHIHQCFEIILLRAGQMQVTVDNQPYTLQKNEAVLIFPNQLHAIESQESEHTLCIFSPEVVKAFSTKLRDCLPENNKFTLSEQTVELFEQLTEQGSEFFKKGVLYLICDQFDRNAAYKKQARDKHNLLQKMFMFVDRNFSSDCSLSGLADELGYNYSYLSRHFKKAVGLSFNAYVNNYRLNHACYLLRNSVDSVLQCAYDSGFISLRSFNLNFKKFYGVTPQEYRKMTKTP